MYQHLYRNKYLDTRPRCVRERSPDKSSCTSYCQGFCTAGIGICPYQFFPIVMEKDLPRVVVA